RTCRLVSMMVRDFAIVDQIDIEFDGAMTVLTGETGAGKSILVDALGLVLGERGSAQLVREGAKRAEFAAAFDIRELEDVRTWLREQELDLDDDCLLRRIIGADGRSRAFINGNAVPVSQLKALGELLIDIHGQHFHQSLGRKTVQRDLLDHYAGLLDVRAETAVAHQTWRAIADKLKDLLDADADRASRVDLLTFQLQELHSLALEDGETDTLLAERQKLQNSGKLAEGVATSLAALMDNDGGNANSLIADASRAIDLLSDVDEELGPLVEMLDSAGIQVAEAADALRRYSERIDMDPARRDWVEERLDAIQAISRKHRIKADEIPALQEKLQQEFDDLAHAEERGKELEVELDKARERYFSIANKLSKGRKKASAEFAAAVTAAMQGLGMPGGAFEVALQPRSDDTAGPSGREDIEFLISANPGQSPQPLSKVASGGELSRMSLSIQVIASDGSNIPTLIFDEVDSGVGGGVAEMVGRRLQELGGSRQVLCVTHLPQVASLAANHFRISKVSDDKTTRTQVAVLDQDGRIDEIARMLGGMEITQRTLDHAAEMLSAGARKSA
ncbi:MAG: DNA repair protein RecN, partial [Pseudomonadota bacterium]